MPFAHVGSATVSGRRDGGVRLRAGEHTVELTALAPDLFRVGLFAHGRTPDYRSEAIARDDWPSVAAELREAAGGLELATAEATAHIALDPLRIEFSDREGRHFLADDPGLEVEAGADTAGVHDLLSPAVRVRRARGDGERMFGCGERTSGLEKTGSHQVFWNVDPPMGHTASLNNLYTSIPFVLSLIDGRAHGVLFDSRHRVEIDLAKADPSRVTYSAAGGDLVYYVILGPTPADVLDRYPALTGRTPMPPRWALGNQQSRWSYIDEGELRRIAGEFRARGIPCDVLYLDIDYMDGYRVFTWDAE